MQFLNGVKNAIILIMNKESILNYLKNVKAKYQEEGFLIQALFGSYSRDEADADSDVDILVEATPAFASKYGFGSIKRIHEIQAELSLALGLPVDLADSTGMGKTGKKFIIDRAIYV
ncbi:putative nucleotidyltransferase [Sulfurimonas gotlandica GD1]|uniref:Putative nucleotidyltransferase n=2 Tax=Sulfurimonas TaxID=202746 RepID=H1FUV8_SULGG|nr:putative nucleotidyltransferase [Sulfurimonas gotlandica GD1]